MFGGDGLLKNYGDHAKEVRVLKEMIDDGSGHFGVV